MKHYVSLSEYPGKQGQYFYTEFFKLHDINADYTPLVATKDTLVERLAEVKKYASGISVSMPHKRTVLKYLDHIDSSAKDYNSCNTIINKDGLLYGYNADLFGVMKVTEQIQPHEKIIILGNGCIGQMFLKYLETNGFNNLNIYSRSLGNWNDRHVSGDILINCTAIGTINNFSPVDSINENTRMVIDMSIKTNQLISQAMELKTTVITGEMFYKSQFIEQYYLYTGIRISSEDYDIVAKNK